jgi:hypothetical protein
MPKDIVSFTKSLTGQCAYAFSTSFHKRFVIFVLHFDSSALAGAAAAACAGEARPVVAAVFVVHLAHTKMQDQQRWWPSSPFPAAGKPGVVTCPTGAS